jgi:epoxyqueuosine reductase
VALEIHLASPVRVAIFPSILIAHFAITFGNAPYAENNISSLKTKLDYPDEMVQEHIQWALAKQVGQR